MSREVHDGSGERGEEEGSLGSGSQTRSLADVGEVKVTPAGMGYGLWATKSKGGQRSTRRAKLSIKVKHHDCISSLDRSSDLHSHIQMGTRHLNCTCPGANLCPPSFPPKPGSSSCPLHFSTPSRCSGLKPWELPWPLLFRILLPIHYQYHELRAYVSRYTQNLTTSRPHSDQPGAGTSMAHGYCTSLLTRRSASTLVPKLYHNMADRSYCESLNPNV